MNTSQNLLSVSFSNRRVVSVWELGLLFLGSRGGQSMKPFDNRGSLPNNHYETASTSRCGECLCLCLSRTNKEVLKDEAALSEKARQGGVHSKILITSAADEQNDSDETSHLTLMIDNASALASRLASLNPEQVPVRRVIYAGESHATEPQSSTSRGIVFAIPRPSAK